MKVYLFKNFEIFIFRLGSVRIFAGSGSARLENLTYSKGSSSARICCGSYLARLGKNPVRPTSTQTHVYTCTYKDMRYVIKIISCNFHAIFNTHACTGCFNSNCVFSSLCYKTSIFVLCRQK